MGLSLIKLCKIAGIESRDGIADELARSAEPVNCLSYLLRRNAYELRRRRYELIARDKAVAVSGVMDELKYDGGANTVHTVPFDAELKGEAVGLGKACAYVGQ